MVIKNLDFLDGIIGGSLEEISVKNLQVIRQERDRIAPGIASIIRLGVRSLASGKGRKDLASLEGAILLAWFLELDEAGEWIRKVAQLPIDKIEEQFRSTLFIDYLPYILAATHKGPWQTLKEGMENSDIDPILRDCFFDALVHLVAQDRVPRGEVVAYFKSALQGLLTGEIEDASFGTSVVSACSDLWPDECLEEIREAFACFLIDPGVIDIDLVLKDHAQGLERCINKLKGEWDQNTLDKELLKREEKQEEGGELLLDVIGEVSEEVEKKLNNIFERNDPCPCGSGKKYKKCCLNSRPSGGVQIEESVIAFDALETYSGREALPESVKCQIQDLWEEIHETPEKALPKIKKLRKRYPEVAIFSNYLYFVYITLDRTREAVEEVKKGYAQFPNYLFSRIEYANYFLRRGEPKRVPEVLGEGKTLRQLYPEREVFHISEWNSFAMCKCKYNLAIGNINQALIYRDMIKKVDPESAACEEVEKLIRTQLFVEAIDARSAKKSL